MDTASTYVVVPFISGLFNVLVDRLASENMRELLMGRDSTANELTKLRTSMMVVKRAVINAEEKQDADPDVKSWLNDVKHAVYDAEDLIDGILTEAALQRREQSSESQHIGDVLSSITATFGRFFAAIDPFHEGIDSRIRELNERFEGFSRLIDSLNLKFGLEQSRALSSSRLTSSFVDESMIYGRDSERDLMIELLQDGVLRADDEQAKRIKKGKMLLHDSIRVLAIIGMPGVGKTALAQLVFNDPRADDIFEFKSWNCVPKAFDIVQIIRSILDLFPQPQETSTRYAFSSLNDLELNQRALRERVAGKRILIVLDDVWEENLDITWQTLLISLTSAAMGSTIIVTTRNKDIARMLHPIYIHSVNELSDDDSWKLFRAKAFCGLHATTDAKLEAIGRKVVEKCKGLPLAVKALGGLLSIDSDATEWEMIANDKIWNLPPGRKVILPALLLSYNYLPAHLRRCFAYCSIFPKSYQFDKAKLVLLWMAEGFIEQARGDNRRLEDIGNMYFHDLLARSFFQVSSSNIHYFVMHDLIHDLAVYVMGEFSFMLDTNSSPAVIGTPRHFSFLQSKYDTIERFRSVAYADGLRTFFPLGTFSSKSSYYLSKCLLQTLEHFCCLRVLSLCGYKITSISPSIGSLKHLRYLDFSFTAIVELPESICHLSNLQTLLLVQCKELISLPKMVRNLVHLRHLDIHGTDKIEEMPDHIGKLKCLQTLTDFVVGEYRGTSIRELGGISQLRGRLCISGLESVVTEADAFEANMRGKTLLDELVLTQFLECSVADRQHERILDALKPHMNLKRLTINFYEGVRFPDWIGDEAFCDLEVLNLEECPNCVELPSLGKLPLLKHLSIKNFKKVESLGVNFYGQHSASSSPFRSLVTIKFEALPKWKTWCSYEGGARPFPCLWELYLKNCSELKGDLSLKVPSLAVLNITGCPKLSGSLPDAPFLRELTLQDFGEVNLKSLAGLSRLAKICLDWGQRVRNDSVSDAQQALRNLSSLDSLSIKIKWTLCLGPWYLPSSIRSLILEVLTSEEIHTFTESCQQLQFLVVEDLRSHLRFLAGSCQLLNCLHISRCDGLVVFPSTLYEGDLNLTSLFDLYIFQCKQLESFGFQAPNLTTLSLIELSHLRNLPDGMNENFPCLQFLHIDKCPLLESFPEDDGLPLHLHTLCIADCDKLGLLPDTMSSSASLEVLEITHCAALMSFPTSGLPPNLQKLQIHHCENLTSLPERISITLKYLSIWKCTKIVSFPQCGLPPSLETLRVIACEELIQNYADWQQGNKLFLKKLFLGEPGDLVSFPIDGSLPTTLEVLNIDEFSSLKSINCRELQRLPALRELEIQRCHSLKSFSDNLPQSLCRLTIQSSPLIEKGCFKSNGNPVDKISHITCLEFSCDSDSNEHQSNPVSQASTVNRDQVEQQAYDKRSGSDGPKQLEELIFGQMY